MRNKIFIKIKKIILIYPMAIILLFEEWGWIPLAALFDYLIKWSFWKKIEGQIKRLSPISVLFVFGAPALALLPVKFFALYLFGNGHIFMGATVLVVAKIVGTAICARIFELAKPALMSLAFFAKWYPKWKRWKDSLILNIRQSFLWKKIRLVKLKLKMMINQ